MTYGGPSSGGDGCDAAALGEDGVPRLAAGVDDGLIGVENAVGDILAQELARFSPVG